MAVIEMSGAEVDALLDLLESGLCPGCGSRSGGPIPATKSSACRTGTTCSEIAQRRFRTSPGRNLAVPTDD